MATLALALLISIIALSRLIGGSQLITANLAVLGWESLYAQPWRILTSPFVHLDLLHFLENLTFLLLFGWSIERKSGSLVFLGIFFGALLTGYVVFINVMHDSIRGISGGICGLFGFSLVANRRTPWWRTLTQRPLHLLYSANLLWSIILDLSDWLPVSVGVAHLNHVVGILYGATFAGTFLLASDRRLRVAVLALPLLLFASQFYSPWQVEWRLLRRSPALVTESATCDLHSTRQEAYTPTVTTFVNASTKAIAVFWLDFEGNAHLYKWLGPGDHYHQQTFIGHPWCIVDARTGQALQSFTVSEPEQTVTIR